MSSPIVPVAKARPAVRRARPRFFLVMAVVAAATVFAGFAPTYYLRGAFDRPALPPFLHLHGVLFTAWVAVFVAQAALVASRRTDLHRRVGAAAGILPVLMVVIGFLAAVGSARRGFTPPGGPPPLVFLAIPVFDLVVFSGLVGAGYALRRRPDAHRRLMLLAMISLLTPAIARLPIVQGAGPLAFFGLTDLFVVACLVRDRLVGGRVHPAFLWGGLALVLSQPLRLAVAATPVWRAFAAWVTGQG